MSLIKTRSNYCRYIFVVWGKYASITFLYFTFMFFLMFVGFLCLYLIGQLKEWTGNGKREKDWHGAKDYRVESNPGTPQRELSLCTWFTHSTYWATRASPLSFTDAIFWLALYLCNMHIVSLLHPIGGHKILKLYVVKQKVEYSSFSRNQKNLLSRFHAHLFASHFQLRVARTKNFKQVECNNILKISHWQEMTCMLF